jgi:predicted nucleotidyltransferase
MPKDRRGRGEGQLRQIEKEASSMKPQSPEEIFQIIGSYQGKLRALGVRKLGLFGSWARRESKLSSDLDFLVELEQETFDSYMNLKAFLEDLFEAEVDLVLVDAIKPRLRDTILAETIYAPGF